MKKKQTSNLDPKLGPTQIATSIGNQKSRGLLEIQYVWNSCGVNEGS